METKIFRNMSEENLRRLVADLLAISPLIPAQVRLADHVIAETALIPIS